MVKRIIALCLIVFMIFSLTACGEGTEISTDERIGLPDRFTVIEYYPDESWYIVVDKTTNVEYILISSYTNMGWHVKSITPLYDSEGNVMIYDYNLS